MPELLPGPEENLTVHTILQIDKQRGRTGQTKRTLAEAQEISKRGYRVILGCQPGSYLERSAREQSLEVFPLPMGKLFSSLIKLTLFLRKERVDLINAHGYRDHFLSAVARKLASGRALVRTKHNHVPLKGGFFSRFLYGKLTDRIVTISEDIRTIMIASGLHPEHVTAIHTAINLDLFSPGLKNQQLIKEFDLSPEYAIIGTVARLSERKGISFLLDAVKILTDAGRRLACLIVGGGGSGSQRKIDVLKRRAESLGISQYLIFTGRRSDIPEILSLLDVFILPSLAEGLGRSLLEAMAAGRAIVASRVGGIPEAVEDGKTGILVPPQDAQALARAIAFLLDNPEQTREMGQAGRRKAEELFDEKKMIDRICSLYEQLLNRNASVQHSAIS
jgi:glycosyltransferase involved in cell wall biosynthesis